MKKLILFFSFLIIACSGGDDDNISKNNSELQGTWSGTFSGDDNGTWSASFNANGVISGTGYSTTFDSNYTMTGTITSNGKVTIGWGDVSTGAVFTGQTNSNSIAGTWINQGAELDGTWSGNKD